MSEGAGRFVPFLDDPDHPGWQRWHPPSRGRFLDLFGPMRARREGEATVRCRLETERRHSNGFGALHGGFLMAVVDMALFWPGHFLGLFERGGGVTLEASTQFIATTRAGEPIEIVSEVLKTTGRLIFVRGVIEQEGAVVCNFSGTLRKITPSFGRE